MRKAVTPNEAADAGRAQGAEDGPAGMGPPPRFRAARFEDMPAVLRLIEQAIEVGCQRHYDADERRAVYVTYAQCAFVDVLSPFETFVAEIDGVIAAFAQLDVEGGRLRALFVDAAIQRRGLGRAMLAHVLERAALRGCPRVHGAMSLNAVPFYERAGFRRCPGRKQLWADGIEIAVVPMERAIERG